MVFQNYSLFPWLSVLDNILFSRRLRANQGGVNTVTSTISLWRGSPAAASTPATTDKS